MSGVLAGSVWVNVLPKMAGFQRDVALGLQGLEKKTAAAGRSLTRNVTLPLGAVGYASVKVATDFNRTFDQMVGLAGVSSKSIDGLKSKVLALSGVTGVIPEELAKGLYFIESSGLKGKRAMDALTVSAKLSTAGLGETQVVADAVTSAMNAYAKSNLSAAQAGDILAATVRDGKGEASAIAPVLGGLLPLSQRLGVSFDQVGASIASMTLLGTSAPEAATALSGFYTSLLSNSPKVVKSLKSVGLTIQGLQDDMANPKKGLPFVLKELENRFHGNIQAMHEAFPNIRGLRALLALTGDNAKNTARIFDDLKHSVGSTGKAFKAVSSDDQFKFQKLKAQLHVVAVQLGNLLIPYLLKAADALTRLINAFQHLSPAMQDFIVKTGVILFLLGPTLSLLSKVIRVFGFFGGIVGSVSKGLLILSGSTRYVGKETTFLTKTIVFLGRALVLLGRGLIFLFTNPIGLIILGIAAVVIGLVLLYKHSNRFRHAIQSALHGAAAGFKALWNAAKATVNWIIHHWRLLVAITGPFGIALVLIVNHFGAIKAAASAVVGFLKSFLGPTFQNLKTIGSTVLGAVKAEFNSLVGVAKDFWSYLKWIADKIGWILGKAGKLTSIAGSIADKGESFLSHLAGGGHLSAGQPAVVGEIGPELWIPDTAGRIVPNNHMAAALGGAGGGRVALTITNWRDGTGFFEAVADGSVNRAHALNKQRRRMRR